MRTLNEACGCAPNFALINSYIPFVYPTTNDLWQPATRIRLSECLSICTSGLWALAFDLSKALLTLVSGPEYRYMLLLQYP